MNKKENLEEPYYGYRIMRYFTIALIAGGPVSIALAIVFTAWVSISCLVFRSNLTLLRCVLASFDGLGE